MADTLETRVALLEQKTAFIEEQMDTSYKTVSKLGDRVEVHIQDGLNKDAQMQIDLNRVTDAVTNLSQVMATATDSLKLIADSSNNYQQKIMKYETVAETLMKIGSIAMVLCSAGWALYTYFADKI
jgi:BMFP domain-containing protein YqiC